MKIKVVGLKITAGQETETGQDDHLSWQTFRWLVNLTGWEWQPLKVVLKKAKQKKKEILCLSHFIIIKLCEAVNVKRLEIIGEQLMFSLKCSPFCNAKSFCTYKVMFMSFIGYYYTITTSIFLYFDWSQMSHELKFVIRNEPWLS